MLHTCFPYFRRDHVIDGSESGISSGGSFVVFEDTGLADNCTQTQHNVYSL